MKDRRIGFVGAGNMASALVSGLFASGLVGRDGVRASDPSQDRSKWFEKEHGVVMHADNASLAAWANLVVLAVKPQVMDPVLAELGPALSHGTLVISIAAGFPLARIEAQVPAGVRTLRAMPNTPAVVRAGATAIAAGSRATAEDLELARQLFGAVGRVVTVAESAMDAVTGLSGSGPAYALLAIEALSDGGVKMGLARDAALVLAAQTVLGAAKLLLDTGEHPGKLRDMVTSPGGTTIAGLHALEAGGVRPALIDAVERATLRSQELGRR